MIAVFFSLFIISLSAHAEDVILRHSFAGNISFELTGNTLRDSNNTCNVIAGGKSSGSISLPPNASIIAAYLYWSGSGGIDTQINFDGQAVNSQNNYTEVFDSRNYYSAKADVTNLVSNNTVANYEVSGLTFDGSNSYCSTGGAYGGWALAIVFEHDDEPLRVINVFDGFKNFWGSEFTLIPDNFVIAANPSSKGGKHAHITWEGDEGNSQARGGFTESLKFEGFDLTNFPLNPADNQFNGYSNVTGTTSGVDIDEYEIGNYLNAGDTNVHTTYSSGQDGVFLTAEFISVPNEPVANLSILQTGPANFIRGQNQDITLSVSNLGPNTASSNTQVTLDLPTGIALSNFSGNQWSCIVSSGTVTCHYLNTIAKNASASSLVLTLIPDSTASNSINLTATTTGIEFDNILSNNTHSKTYNVVSADLSRSKKTVTDINGGNVQPGDTLRYQIDVIETNGVPVSGMSLEDHLPANISSFNIISIPSGASNNSQPAPAGSNTTGLVSILNISIAANATESIIFDAVISSSAPANTAITNTATIRVSGLSDIPVGPATVHTSRPSNPAAGNKPLYLRQTSNLSRVQPTSSAHTVLADLAENTWIITPTFQQQFQFSSSNVSAYLFLQNSYTSGSWVHTVTVNLLHNNNSIGSIQRTITVPSLGISGDNVALFDFVIPLTSPPIIQVGDTLALKITNDSQYAVDNLHVFSIDPNISGSDAVSPHSLVSLPAATVINVDQIQILDSATSLPLSPINPGKTFSIQAQISDPFGSFDITSANISMSDPQGINIITNQAMGVLSDSGAATKTFDYDFTLPVNAPIGDWIISITGLEGIENEISHTSQYIMEVSALLPNIQLVKSVEVFSDPINGIVNFNNYPKALPSAILTYTIEAINTGPGAAENNSIWISDSIPDNTYMMVKDFDDISGKGPVIEDPVNPTNGLSYQFIALDSISDDIEFSENDGADFDYSPVADIEGIDVKVTHFRINPTGSFQAPLASESSNKFTIKFRIQLQ